MTSKTIVAYEENKLTSRAYSNNMSYNRLTKEGNIDEISKSTNQPGKCKILLIGDSHMKGHSSELRYKLGDTYEILGIVKPNASINQLTATARQDINELTQKDFLVFWGGSNDASKNNARSGLNQEVNYLRGNIYTNSIVITVPHKFDLNCNSCVNEEIRRLNRRLTTVVKNLNKLNAEMERGYYTNHGLHYNKKGKMKMALKIYSAIQEIAELQSKMTVTPQKCGTISPDHVNPTTESSHLNKADPRNGPFNA
jgi:hypothetical protein